MNDSTVILIELVLIAGSVVSSAVWEVRAAMRDRKQQRPRPAA